MNRILLSLAAVLICASSALADQPVGFGRATAGGAGGPACHVRDEPSLRACVSGEAPAVVIMDQALTFNPGKQKIEVGSNKTIDGGGRLSIVHDWIAFELIGSRNVIIRDIRFRGSGADVFPQKQSNCAHPSRPKDVEGCGVSISMSGATRDVWIDHNEFDTCGNKCITAYGFARTPGPVASPDLITISYNIFRDSYFAMLFGISNDATDAQMPQQPGRITLYGNLFDRIKERSPRAASGYKAHVFNNVIKDFGGPDGCKSISFGFGPSVIKGGEILLENNVIEAWPSPNACKQADDFATRNRTPAALSRGPGRIRSVGNLGRNGAMAEGNDQVFAPDYPYSPLPANAVEAYVRANAGVRPGG
ncbi:MAG: pectate lyase family protein [Caulobacteraceae bacterium]